MSRIRFFILPILLGLIGGFLGWWMGYVGMFVEWKSLPTDLLRPQKPIDVLGGNFDADGHPYIYIETDDGKLYSCQYPVDVRNFLMLYKCWVQTDSPQIGTSDKGCDANSNDVARHRWLVISEPPGTVTDRIRLEICGASSGVYEYVLLEDGTVWVWYSIRNGPTFQPKFLWEMFETILFIGIWICPGISIGLILSYVGQRWLRRRRI